MCGCGGESTEQVSGRVADGYLQGVTVFWDCNGNMRLDNNEPFTISGRGGQYTIVTAPVAQAPLLQCTLRAKVPASAIDEDTGQSVGDQYMMSAVSGSPEFISPLTTLLDAGVYTEAELRQKFPQSEKLAFTDDYVAAGDAGNQLHNAAKFIAIGLQAVNGLITTDDAQGRRDAIARAMVSMPPTAFSSQSASSALIKDYKSSLPRFDALTNNLSATLDAATFEIVDAAFSGPDDGRRPYMQMALDTIKRHPEAVYGNSINWALVPYAERSAWSTQIQGGLNGFSDSAEVTALLQNLTTQRALASAEIDAARRAADNTMWATLLKSSASMLLTSLDSIAKLTNVNKVYLVMDLNKRSKLKAAIVTFKKGFEKNERFWATLSGCADFLIALSPDNVPEVGTASKFYEVGLSGSKCIASLAQSEEWSTMLGAWSAGSQIGASDGERVLFWKGVSDMIAALIDSSGIGWASAVYNETFGMYFTATYNAYNQDLVGQKAIEYFDLVTDETIRRFDEIAQSYSSAIINARINRYIKPINAAGLSIRIPESAFVSENLSAFVDQRISATLAYRIFWSSDPSDIVAGSNVSEWTSSGGARTIPPVQFTRPGNYPVRVEIYDTAFGGGVSPFQILTQVIRVSCPAGTTANPDGDCRPIKPVLTVVAAQQYFSNPGVWSKVSVSTSNFVNGYSNPNTWDIFIDSGSFDLNNRSIKFDVTSSSCNVNIYVQTQSLSGIEDSGAILFYGNNVRGFGGTWAVSPLTTGSYSVAFSRVTAGLMNWTIYKNGVSIQSGSVQNSGLVVGRVAGLSSGGFFTRTINVQGYNACGMRNFTVE